MLNFLLSMLPNFLLGFWRKLPDEYKKEIIDYVVRSFKDKIRQYYRNYNKQANKWVVLSIFGTVQMIQASL